MKIEDITIIVTTFKSDKKIDLCLESIDKKAKVIIIENSGNKDFKDLIEKKYSNIECILASENLGYAKANNLGLKKVNTKFALVLNPDTILKKNTLENFLKSASLVPELTKTYDKSSGLFSTKVLHSSTE